MFQATRRRLALWYATVTAVLLLLVAAGFYGYARGTLIERVDDTLNHVVEVVVRSLAIDPAVNGGAKTVDVEASFRDTALLNGDEIWDGVEDDRIDLEWFNPAGKLLWSTFAYPIQVPLHVNPNGETVTAPPQARRSPEEIAEGVKGGDSGFTSSIVLRQVTEPVKLRGQLLGYLRVSHPWFEVSQPVQKLVLELSVGMTVMAIAVWGLAWFLSGLAMEPVRASYQQLRQFTADASHELRNPIATLQTQVQGALADSEPVMERTQLETMERLTRRLGRLVEDLLFLARQDGVRAERPGELVELDLLVASVVEEQEAIADRKGVQLEWELEDDEDDLVSYGVQGDRDQLARLLTNLISNGVQYTQAGGSVTVQLRRLLDGDTVEIQVRDTGAGIPEGALGKLFDRFYRVDPARSRQQFAEGGIVGGSGLGLAIAQTIVKNHRGTIGIASKVDQGTTVTVTLPSDMAADR
ncbi:MAG: HAMP domain-containing sensor histidine kinase [Cyanobacteria bacterium P01_C01_bin.89]